MSHAPFSLTALSGAFFMLAACATPDPELAAVPVAPVAAPQPAPTQPMACRPHDEVIEHLAWRYGEAPVALGVTNKGALVELLSKPDGGTWTLIVTTPQGMSCLVAAGEGWRNMEQISLEPEA